MTYSQRIYQEMYRQGLFKRDHAPLAYCLRKVESARETEEFIRRLRDA